MTPEERARIKIDRIFMRLAGKGREVCTIFQLPFGGWFRLFFNYFPDAVSLSVLTFKESFFRQGYRYSLDRPQRFSYP